MSTFIGIIVGVDTHALDDLTDDYKKNNIRTMTINGESKDCVECPTTNVHLMDNMKLVTNSKREAKEDLRSLIDVSDTDNLISLRWTAFTFNGDKNKAVITSITFDPKKDIFTGKGVAPHPNTSDNLKIDATVDPSTVNSGSNFNTFIDYTVTFDYSDTSYCCDPKVKFIIPSKKN